jgi:hypothetical protein
MELTPNEYGEFVIPEGKISSVTLVSPTKYDRIIFTGHTSLGSKHEIEAPFSFMEFQCYDHYPLVLSKPSKWYSNVTVSITCVNMYCSRIIQYTGIDVAHSVLQVNLDI